MMLTSWRELLSTKIQKYDRDDRMKVIGKACFILFLPCFMEYAACVVANGLS